VRRIPGKRLHALGHISATRSATTVSQQRASSGAQLRSLLGTEAIERIADDTRRGGAQVLGLKTTSSAYNAPATAITTMVDAQRHDRKRVLPCVRALAGEYGQDAISIGVPAILGLAGVEKIIALPMSEDGAANFRLSAETIRTEIAQLAET
jgi:malate dehydrogenase